MAGPWKLFAPQPAPLTGTGFRPYAFALIVTLVSLTVTRFTWPFFAGTPFVPLFSAVVVTSHWGSGPAGILAMLLVIVGAPYAFPAGGPVQWDPQALVVFIGVSLVANRVLVGRNRAESALRASEAELRATWDHAALGLALLDRFGRIERINPALERLLGYPVAAYVGTSFSTFSHPDEVTAEHARLAVLMTGTDAFYQREQRYVRHDGTFLWGRVTVSLIRGADGDATGALAVLEDVTARRDAEVELRASEAKFRRAQKMEAVGQLAAGVAHNFNNLLTVIGGFADLLLDRRRGHEPDESDIEEIRRASDRGAGLTRQLLAVGRKHDPTEARIDLNRAVVGIREMLTRVIREDIELTTLVTPAPAAILIDASDLDQVILNLVINARDALPIGGTIEIDVAPETIDATSGTPDLSASSGEYVRLRVRDNGTGMTPDVQAHLFEPFFTTKEVGHGTGLGLAFVHGIVRLARGFITIESEPAKGTTVSVYFPRDLDGVAEAAPEPVVLSTAHVPPGATVLLVEDEDAVRNATARMLSRAGYRVLSAATPREAVDLFDRNITDIDLLLTDIVMPEMHGPQLAQRLVAQRPELRVLFVSGYSETIPAGTTTTGQVAFLAKPFQSSRLVTTVAELLSTRSN